MTQELQDFLYGRNNHSKKECLDKINEEMWENVKLFNKGNLTFEEFHWVQGELVKLKNELGFIDAHKLNYNYIDENLY